MLPQQSRVIMHSSCVDSLDVGTMITYMFVYVSVICETDGHLPTHLLVLLRCLRFIYIIGDE